MAAEIVTVIMKFDKTFSLDSKFTHGFAVHRVSLSIICNDVVEATSRLALPWVRLKSTK